MTYSPSHPPSSVPDLGLLLRRLRVAAGLTQEELAERAGISSRAVSDIERGLRTGIYRDTAERLASALGLDPVARRDLTEAARRPPSAARDLGSLPPPPPTPLHGRDGELRELARLIEPGGRRLVTLVGAPGVGKSRLALEAAHLAAAAGRAAWFVALAPISRADSVPSAVLRALDLPDTGDALRLIAQRVPPGGLVILDNFEHLLDAAMWLGDLLAGCPSITVLTTSRAPLRLRLEHQLMVEPISEEAALELLHERAAAGRHAQRWGPGDRELARHVCAQLDCLPLALELAAAALSSMTLASLRAGLEEHLDVLGEGMRDMPARHRNVRSAVAWSADLLSPADRRLLRSLSVFSGTFAIDAVRTVARLDVQGATRGLGRLVEQSLVSLSGDPRATTRYQLLEVVRQAVRDEALAAGELLTFRLRHLEHYVALAEEAEPHLHGPGRAEWSEVLLSEADNLEAALAFAAEHGQTDLGLRLGTALWRWWRQRDALNPGRAHFRRLLAAPPGSPAVRARALWAASWLALHQQDHAESRRLNEELLSLATKTGDQLARRNALTGLGMVLRAEGAAAASLPLFREALELATRAGDRWILATSIFNVAQPLLETGAFVEGEEMLEEARHRYLELGDLGFAARMLLYRSQSAIRLDETDRAAAHVAEAARTFVGLDEPWGQVECLEMAGVILAAAGREEAGAAALAKARATRALLGSAQLGPDARIVEEVVTAARLRSGDRWRAASTAGEQKPLDAALAAALGELARLRMDGHDDAPSVPETSQASVAQADPVGESGEA